MSMNLVLNAVRDVTSVKSGLPDQQREQWSSILQTPTDLTRAVMDEQDKNGFQKALMLYVNWVLRMHPETVDQFGRDHCGELNGWLRVHRKADFDFEFSMV